ncbi:hypothetical protein V6L78_19665 [Pseudomonas canadensis]|uniref:hypothetical protein n=1 Tax=Pseudomonas canadensis TaxID=915099 RepID=UPI0030CFB8EC
MEIVNDFGTSLLDDAFKGYYLHSKGIGVIGGGVGLVSVATCSTPVVSGENYPVIAVKFPGFTQLYKGDQSASLYTWVFYIEEAFKSVPFEYFIFKEALPGHALGTGLLVLKNAQDQVIYDSDANYLNVVDVIYTPYNQPITRSYGTDHTYAICVTQPMVRRVTADTPGGWGRVDPFGAKITSGGTGIFQEWTYRTSSGGDPTPPPGGNVWAGFLVADVTSF